MSGRNNRIVRNRERSRNVSLNSIIVQKMISILVIVTIIIVIFFVIGKIKNKKKNAIVVESKQDIAYEYFILIDEDNVGVIDRKGNEILKAKYSTIDIPNPSKDVFVCYSDDKSKVLNQKGEEILTDYEHVEVVKSSDDLNEIEKNVLKYKKDDLYGLIDLEGNLITEAIYSEICSMDYRPGRILVKKDEQYGVLDSNGNIVMDIKYDQISADGYYSKDGLYSKTGFIVSQKGKDGVHFGYIDDKGEMVLDVKYESIERALEYDDDNIYLIVMQNGKKGVFKNKKKMIDLNFQEIHYSSLSKVFVVNKNGKYGFYHLSGKIILKPEYTNYSIAGNYISVSQEDKTQLFDINGNLVGSNSYKKMIETDNPTYFIAEDEEGYDSIISKDIEISEKYTQVSYAFDNFFIFTDESGKTGVVNALINEIEIEPVYDFILLIENTKSLQAIDGMNNLVDIYSDNLIKTVTMVDGIVEHINQEYSIVYSETDMKYINSKGQVVENTEIYPDKNLYAFEEKGKWGFSDSNGKIVIDCEYDIVTEFNEYGYAGIKKDGKWGVVNEEGKIIVEPSYELDTYYFPQFIGKYLFNQTEITYCEKI